LCLWVLSHRPCYWWLRSVMKRTALRSRECELAAPKQERFHGSRKLKELERAADKNYWRVLGASRAWWMLASMTCVQWKESLLSWPSVFIMPCGKPPLNRRVSIPTMPFNLPIALTWLRIAMIPLIVALYYVPSTWLAEPTRDAVGAIFFITAAL